MNIDPATTLAAFPITSSEGHHSTVFVFKPWGDHGRIVVNTIDANGTGIHDSQSFDNGPEAMAYALDRAGWDLVSDHIGQYSRRAVRSTHNG